MEGTGRDVILHTLLLCLEGLRKITQNLSKDIWSLGRVFNLGPPKYEAVMLTT